MNRRAEHIGLTLEQQNRVNELRQSFSDLYDKIDKLCKDVRETSLAYTKLEEAQAWAIKGISREINNDVQQ